MFRCQLVLIFLTTMACESHKETEQDSGGGVGSCDSLSVEDCGVRGDCATIEGWKVESTESDACVDFEIREAKGCMDADLGCDSALALAAPADAPNNVWLFSSLCLPKGWAERDWEDLPDCE
jgi:hypothetical protein